jgi:hypothetical protein
MASISNRQPQQQRIPPVDRGLVAMRPVSREELEQICERVGVILAEDTAAGIGLVPQFHHGPRRIVTVSVGEPGNEYVHEMAGLILGLCDTWILIPRYSRSSGIGFADPGPSAVAVAFSRSDLASLAQHLSAFRHPQAIYSDLWLLSGSGKILLRWTHHVYSDGLDVEFVAAPDAGQLLVSLNEAGAEFQFVSNIR